MDESFIYTIKNNLPSDICKAIIKKFESHPEQWDDGAVGENPINKEWKDSKEICITENLETWGNAYEKMTFFLKRGLHEYIEEYTKFLHKKIGVYGDTKFVTHFSIGNNNTLGELAIQRIRKGSRYRWHSDNCSRHPNRILTFMWYLNTLEEDEGGKTAFIDGRKVRPEEGKLIFFPAAWTALHCGELIKAEYKYLLVGTVDKLCDKEFKE
jgi:hypothetical protein